MAVTIIAPYQPKCIWQPCQSTTPSDLRDSGDNGCIVVSLISYTPKGRPASTLCDERRSFCSLRWDKIEMIIGD
ncbi:hypothetical protein JZ751_018003 [Albula glossodonta]|uniref:Uncharacterized protein n=1 Tax=Albula glossodonta TaxID=121402 RepID=A0A8T2PQ14_9TELE|nr:hypothetical protein JZ751_018003 [Albula glossodonta]